MNVQILFNERGIKDQGKTVEGTNPIFRDGSFVSVHI